MTILLFKRWGRVGQGGGGQNIIAIIKLPTPTAEYKMLPLMSCLFIRVVYSYLLSYNFISMSILHKTFGR